MSYKIGQFRKDMTSSYLTELSLSSQNIFTSLSNIIGDLRFRDVALSINGGFSYQKSYYVQLQIERTSLDQNFTISLGNVDGEGQITSQQYLKTFYVPKIQNSNQLNKNVILELVFNSNINLSHLIVRLNRTIEDYKLQTDGITGRTFNVVLSGSHCYEIENIIGSLNGVSELLKLGVQGRPGLLMCINGEEIRVGPSGIYEIKNGYKVNFIGFIIKDSSNEDYFILDYQY